jgi:hypothetical protein
LYGAIILRLPGRQILSRCGRLTLQGFATVVGNLLCNERLGLADIALRRHHLRLAIFCLCLGLFHARDRLVLKGLSLGHGVSGSGGHLRTCGLNGLFQIRSGRLEFGCRLQGFCERVLRCHLRIIKCLRCFGGYRFQLCRSGIALRLQVLFRRLRRISRGIQIVLELRHRPLNLVRRRLQFAQFGRRVAHALLGTGQYLRQA